MALLVGRRQRCQRRHHAERPVRREGACAHARARADTRWERGVLTFVIAVADENALLHRWQRQDCTYKIVGTHIIAHLAVLAFDD